MLQQLIAYLMDGTQVPDIEAFRVSFRHSRLLSLVVCTLKAYGGRENISFFARTLARLLPCFELDMIVFQVAIGLCLVLRGLESHRSIQWHSKLWFKRLI